MKTYRVTLIYLMELEVPDEYKENDIYNQAVAEETIIRKEYL